MAVCTFTVQIFYISCTADSYPSESSERSRLAVSNSKNLDFKIREVAERIRAVRESVGLSPEEMAQKTEVSTFEYLAYEGGAKDLRK